MEVKELTATTTSDSTPYVVKVPVAGATLIIETDADVRIAINSNATADYTTYTAMRSPYYLTPARDTFNKIYYKTQ
jgi:hypothetical protein